MALLSPVDLAFFLLETEQRPMNVGALVVLRPPQGQGARFLDRLTERMARCPVGPPFNYRLKKAAVTGVPTLVVDDHIDPKEQVFRHRLPANSDQHALYERVCAIHQKRLDRSRPLWEVHLFDGLAGGRVALYFKTHHGLIDGIGFIRIVVSTVSRTPRSRKPAAIWSGMLNVPSPASGNGEAGEAPGGLMAFAREAQRTASDMLRLMWHQGLRDLGLGRGLVAPFVSTPDVLKTEPSPHRVLEHCVLPLTRVRAISRASGAKINDVLLAALDLAMSRYLEERGSPPDKPLVADMPVALHDHGGTGNRITILQVPMGRPGGTPAERLRDVLHETSQLKEEVRALSGETLMLYSIVQHALASAIEALRLGQLPMLANTVISNPAGLDHKVYFNGAEVELALPVSVVAHHQVLNITVTTYVEELHVTFIALREAIPDLQRLAEYTTRALVELERDVLPRPSRRRRPVRPERRASVGRAAMH